MRIRSIPGAVREIRQVDSATAVNEGMLRELIERGEIISERVGAKTVVDVDTVIEVLCRMSGCGQGSVPHISAPFGKPCAKGVMLVLGRD